MSDMSDMYDISEFAAPCMTDDEMFAWLKESENAFTTAETRGGVDEERMRELRRKERNRSVLIQLRHIMYVC